MKNITTVQDAQFTIADFSNREHSYLESLKPAHLTGYQQYPVLRGKTGFSGGVKLKRSVIICLRRVGLKDSQQVTHRHPLPSL